MTEFKAIKMNSVDVERLQKHFDNGWEYVDGFSQTVSITSNTYNNKYGDILIILKKEIPTLN